MLQHTTYFAYLLSFSPLYVRHSEESLLQISLLTLYSVTIVKSYPLCFLLYKHRICSTFTHLFPWRKGQKGGKQNRKIFIRIILLGNSAISKEAVKRQRIFLHKSERKVARQTFYVVDFQNGSESIFLRTFTFCSQFYVLHFV